MDCPLDLSPFETFVPDSLENPIKALQLLGTLSEVTRESLEAKAQAAKTSTPPAASNPTPGSRGAKPAAQSGSAKNSLSQKALTDPTLVEALRDYSQKRSALKKGLGTSSPILRPNKK